MLRQDATDIIRSAIKASLPYEQTAERLKKLDLPADGITVFSIGKAAIPMAGAASDVLGSRIKTGLAVTKYGHTGTFRSPYFEIIEAAHPVSDENSLLAAEKALCIADGLTENDTVIVLLSGGGSALFEKSAIAPEAQRDITEKLLARGAEIGEINAIRRRLSLVKGGRFASRCYPAKVITLALSDVLSNDKSVIASGITVPDETSDEEVRALAEKYLYDVPGEILAQLFRKEELKLLDGGYHFIGDIHSLCSGAVQRAEELGYKAECISKALTGEARERAVDLLDSVPYESGKHAYIWGGETTVTLRGSGKGGRNQEMALTAAIVLRGAEHVLFASAGSDGTDGPTDAAGGIAQGDTFDKIKALGMDPEDELNNNNSYYALQKADALITTGPTGTNVNDITVILTDYD